ncbi:MAG: hypothetical protein A2X36_11740 [Elusimicrobia bacterium GWA2_69_24]|nr:MAG: hypothetical protein A2X36_11740 [Elusimicrobia bacterium GWA2_69_24]HBL17347.1 quinolinate synthase [Elusimicrobiota bacterium]
MPIKSGPEPSAKQVADEVRRLCGKGLDSLGFAPADLAAVAPVTWRINRLKAEKKAVIPAHVYQRPEVVAGVADFTGDSYALSKRCAEVRAERIVFCGVRFMAETAKILNPAKEVLLPAKDSGCTLADSITASDVRAAKRKYPGVPVVSYINTTAEVKAESDVIVTSANAAKILRLMFEDHKRVLFLPDAWMGSNLARQLGKKPGSELLFWDGKCIVHENFDPAMVALCRRTYPGVKILAHAECNPAFVELVDFVGGTADMLRYVRETDAPYYMLVTECGLGEVARTAMPEKHFIPMCRLCPYMKATTLQSVLQALEDPQPWQKVTVDPAVAEAAKRSIERMFELAES